MATCRPIVFFGDDYSSEGVRICKHVRESVYCNTLHVSYRLVCDGPDFSVRDIVHVGLFVHGDKTQCLGSIRINLMGSDRNAARLEYIAVLPDREKTSRELMLIDAAERVVREKLGRLKCNAYAYGEESARYVARGYMLVGRLLKREDSLERIHFQKILPAP